MPKQLGTDEWKLFDLSRDAAEIRDLSAEQPDKLEEMVALWNQYREENGVLDIVPGVAK
jgi:arylsulfatase